MEVAEGPDAGANRSAGRLAAVHTVTAADVAAGTYGIADVVLPLPGSRIRYPEHSTAQVSYFLAAARQPLIFGMWMTASGESSLQSGTASAL